MDDMELRQAGQKFSIGEDLYGISVEQLKERLEILSVEQARITCAISKKASELISAESLFKKN